MLILSSQDFFNKNSKQVIIDNLNKPLNECRILFFPNQNAKITDIKNRVYHYWMRDLGFELNNIYVFDYENTDNFRKLDIDMVYVGGGNTFLTLDRLRKSGGDRLLVEYINQGVTYVGGSAGAHIVTKKIEHVKQFDSVPEGFNDYNGLGFYNGILFCHYSSSRKAAADRVIAEGKYQVTILSDYDSLIIK